METFDPSSLPGVTAEQMRAACITLADLSLTAARGDKRAARGILRTVLEAIGVLPYKPGPRKYKFGEVRPS